MSPLVWDLAHVGNYEELLAAPRRRRQRAALRPEIDDLYDAFEHPRADRPSLPLLSPAESLDYLGLVRRQVLDALDGYRAWTTRTRCWTRFRLSDGAAARAPARRDDAGHPPAAPRCAGPAGRGRTASAARVQPSRRRGAGAGRAVRDGHLDRPVGATTTSGRRTGRPARVLPRHHAGLERRLPAPSSRPVATTTPRWWSTRGLAVALPVGQAHARPSGVRADSGSWLRAGSACSSQLPDDEPVQHVCYYEAEAYARWVGRRLPDRGGVGEGGVLGPGHRAPSGATRGATTAPDRRARQPRSAALPAAPVGSFPAGASPYGVHAAARRRLGVDLDRLRRPSRVLRLPVPGVLGGVLRRRLQGAARRLLGHRRRSPAATTFRNWDYPIRRQIFAGFRTRAGRLMCRHLAYLGRADHAGGPGARPAALAAAAVLGAPSAAARHRQRRRLRRRLVRAGRDRAGPLPAGASRSGPTPRSLTWRRPSSSRVRPRGGPLRDGRASAVTSRAPRRSPPALAVQPQRAAGRLAARLGKPSPTGRSTRGGVGAGRLGAAVRPCRVAAGWPASDAGRRAARRRRRGRSAVGGGRLTLLATDGTAIAATCVGEPVFVLSSATGARRGGLRAVRRRSRAGARCPTRPSCIVDRDGVTITPLARSPGTSAVIATELDVHLTDRRTCAPP